MILNRFLKRITRLALAAGLAATGLAAAPQPARAADLTLAVDTILDSNAPAYQACTAAPGDCSLRGAISKANADLGTAYTIQLEPGATYALSLTGAGEANNTTGDLNVRAGLTIDGRGATIDGLGSDRVFRMISGDVTLIDLTITNGHAPDGSLVPAVFPEPGGGLYITTPGTVTLTNCKILNNRAGNGRPGANGSPAGAGAATAGGNGGSAAGGGGIYASGPAALVLDGVTVQGNTAGTGGPGGAGGSGNEQFPAAGGGSGGSGGSGGGIYVGYATLLQMTNITVRDNRAGDGGTGGPGGQGGDNLLGNGTSGGAGGFGGWGSNAGGVYGSLVDVSRSVIYGNFAGTAGSGGPGGAGGSGGAGTGGTGGAGGNAGALAGSGGGMEHAYSSNPGLNRITNVTMYGNRAGLGGAGGPGGQPGSGTSGPGGLGSNGAVSYDGEGGGLYNTGSQDLYLTFVTVTQNAGRLGAGVHNGGTLYAKNSIFAANQTLAGAVGTDIDINNVATPFYSDGYNLFSSYVSGQGTTDQVVTNVSALGLLLLNDNGGPTLTVAITEASPARGLADCTDRAGQPVTVDQRGLPRPDSNGFCDAGAFQFQIPVQPRILKHFPLVFHR